MSDSLQIYQSSLEESVALRRRLVEDFLNSLSESTKENYRADLKDFANFLQMPSSEEAAKEFIGKGVGAGNELALKYKTHLRERELAPKTINRRLAALKSLVKFSNLVGLISWRLSIKGEKVQRYKDTRGMSVAVLGEMLDKTSENQNANKAIRDTAIIRLFGDLGLRREEVATLDFPRDVDLAQNELWILGKGKVERERVSLAEDTAKAVRAWVAIRGDFEGALFTSFSNRSDPKARISLRGLTYLISQSAKAVGVKSSPHKLRHTAITEAAIQIQKAGMPLEELLDFSRHTDIRTALIYRDSIENQQGIITSMVAQRVSAAVKESKKYE